VFPYILVVTWRFWELLNKIWKAAAIFEVVTRTRRDSIVLDSVPILLFDIFHCDKMLLGLKCRLMMRITLMYKVYPEILEVTSEGSSEGKSQTPDSKWPSSTFRLHFSVLFLKNRHLHTYETRIIQNWLQNSEPRCWIFFVNWKMWISHSNYRNLLQLGKVILAHLKIVIYSKKKNRVLKILLNYAIEILRHSLSEYWLW